MLTCPACGHAKRELMPTDACQFFYECEHCKTVLRPKVGDCCVFCPTARSSVRPCRCSGLLESCGA